MKIGVPKEIKNHEYRVGLIPLSVAELIREGHEVLIERSAGVGAGFSDDDYRAVGASVVDTAQAVFDQSRMIVKVKEPQTVERAMLTERHLLFTYLHLAPDRPQTEELIASGACCVAYETVTDAQGRLPLLAPMSEVAGRLSVQAGAHCLERAQGGRGILLGGVAGVQRGHVLVLGGGVVGRQAIRMALGLEAQVTVLDTNLDSLRLIDQQFEGRVNTRFSTHAAVAELVQTADLVIGSVLIPGASAPKLVTEEMVKTMAPGSVLVDVAIDQGGCFATSRATTHADPTYLVHDVVHYCVANMPGAVPRTSSLALNQATLPFVKRLAGEDLEALKVDPHLRAGLAVMSGSLVSEHVAEAHQLPCKTAEEMLA
ncbi:MAG: alanine dehydrogenase [Pseudomonadales bacterium]